MEVRKDMGGGCGRVYGISGEVCWGVGGGKERFGMWGPNTSVPSRILTSANLPK